MTGLSVEGGRKLVEELAAKTEQVMLMMIMMVLVIVMVMVMMVMPRSLDDLRGRGEHWGLGQEEDRAPMVSGCCHCFDCHQC